MNCMVCDSTNIDWVMIADFDEKQRFMQVCDDCGYAPVIMRRSDDMVKHHASMVTNWLDAMEN